MVPTHPVQLDRLPWGTIVFLKTRTGRLRFAKISDPDGGAWWVMTNHPRSLLHPELMEVLAESGMLLAKNPALGVIRPLDEPLPEGALKMDDGLPGGYAYVKPKKPGK